MIDILVKENCCGCYACANSCPVNCITLEYDEEGFTYPKVDTQKCINCGLCEKNCPMIHTKADKNIEPTAYAVNNKDEEIRWTSSSGGVFHAVAKEIIKEGGVVFGSALVEGGRRAEHKWVDKEEDLAALRGSKYIQSAILNTYTEAKEFLTAGRNVLFTGTPCQIAGLKTFLGKEYDNLFCMDIICHGVPSQKVWEKYLTYREKRAGAKAKEVCFRKKIYGWKGFSMYIKFENGKVYQRPFAEDMYMNVFFEDVCLRPSCYQCPFKKMTSSSDLMIADFWGVGEVEPDMDDDRGTSLLLIHSQKGTEMFEKIKDGLKYAKVPLKEALKENPRMLTSVPYNQDRETFFQELEGMSFSKLAKNYAPPKLDNRPKAVIVRILRRIGIYDKIRKPNKQVSKNK